MFEEQDFQWEEPSGEYEYPSYACTISLNGKNYYFDNQDIYAEPILVSAENPLDIVPINVLSEYEFRQVILQLEDIFIDVNPDDFPIDAPYNEELELLYEEQLYQSLMRDFSNIKRYK